MATPAPLPEPDAEASLRVARQRDGELAYKRTFIEGRPALYGIAGTGDLPVVFVHGWGLAHHAYRGAVRAIAEMGTTVYAPALPGFGGTADLPRRHFSLRGFGRWLDAFFDAVGIDGPAVVIGHSFGGGVAIRLAHDHPERVRSLVLVNSIGGSAWRETDSGVKAMRERPLWDWGLHFPSDLLPLGQLARVLPVVLEDAVPNLLRNPRNVIRVAQLARRADLTPELEALKQRGLPVVVLWGADDKIIPRESFNALCRAIGREGEVVDGNHSWLLADPDAFGEVVTNSIEVARLARVLEDEEHKAGRKARRRRGVLGTVRSTPHELTDLTSARPDDES